MVTDEYKNIIQFLRYSGFSFGHCPCSRSKFSAFSQKAGHHGLVSVADGHIDGPYTILIHGLYVEAAIDQHLNQLDIVFYKAGMVQKGPLLPILHGRVSAGLDQKVERARLA